MTTTHIGNHGNTLPDGNDSTLSFTYIDSHDCVRGPQGFSLSLQPLDTHANCHSPLTKYVKFSPSVKKTLFTPDIEPITCSKCDADLSVDTTKFCGCCALPAPASHYPPGGGHSP